jgi:hypothetical protein
VTLAEEIRAEFSRIRRRYEGCETADIKTAVVGKIETYIKDLEDRVSALPAEEGVFGLVEHLSEASRENPMSAAFAVNARKARAVL